MDTVLLINGHCLINNNNQLINSPINNVYNTTNNTKSLTPKRKIQVANSNVRNKKYKKNLCDMNEFNLIENSHNESTMIIDNETQQAETISNIDHINDQIDNLKVNFKN